MAEIQPNKKVSEESAAAAVAGTDLFRLVQGTGTDIDPYVSVKATVADLATFLGTGTGGGVPIDATPGSVLYVADDGTMASLPPTTDGFVLTLVSGKPAWVAEGAPAPTTAFRWIRVYIIANGGDMYTAIGELELHSTVGGSDITSPSTPTYASSSFSSTPSLHAVDNDQTVAWINNGDGFPNWLAVDLGTAQTIVEATLSPQNTEGGSDRRPRSPRVFAIQGSNDPVSSPYFITNWTTLHIENNYTAWVIGTPTTFTF